MLQGHRHSRYGRPVGDPTDLLRRAQRGDDRAFAEFVRTMHPSVWRFCRHIVGPDDASDATQETFISAWRALPSFRGDSSARTWLFVIARNGALRVAGRRNRWQLLAARCPTPAAPPDPERTAEIDDLLSSLPADRKIALVLTQVIGMTYAEAAEICSCPVGTIRSRVARARCELLEWSAAAPEARRAVSGRE